MDEFSTLCLSTQEKIEHFIKFSNFKGKVNLQKVIEFSKEYKWTKDAELKSLKNVEIKEEIDIELDEVKPNIVRSVTSNILMMHHTYKTLYIQLSFY